MSHAAVDTSSSQTIRLEQFLVPLGLLAAVLIAYGPALGGSFIWDDDYYVVNNLMLRDQAGLQQIWLGLIPSLRDYPAPQYYPMTFTSLWIDFRLWGLNPRGYHITNVVLHALTAWTLLVILRRLVIPGALLAAFVFALHPIHVESVAWITERKNVLSGLFYLLSALVYLRFAGLDGHVPQPIAAGEKQAYRPELPSEPWKVFVLSLLLFVLALLSKSVTATLPAAILLVVFFKRRRIDLQKDVVPLLPFFALGLAMSSVTSWMERNHVGAIGAEWTYSWAERTIIAGQAVWFYLGKLLLPINLTFIYDKWPIEPARVLVWLWPVTAVGVVCGALALRKKIGDGPLIGLLFFGGTALPALGFFNYFPLRYAFVADHFVYLASLGIIVPLCAVAARYGDRSKPAGIAAGVVVCVVLGVLTMRQSRIYQDPGTLWTDTINKSPRAWMAWNNLGIWHLGLGEIDKAESHFQTAAKIHKDFSNPIYMLGRVAELRRNAVEAERLYEIAAKMDEQYVERDRLATGEIIPRRQHALPLTALGRLAYGRGELDRAFSLLDRALELSPDHVDALTLMGNVLLMQKQHEAAGQFHARAVQLAPTRRDVRLNFANYLAENGKPDEAFRIANAVHREDPKNVESAVLLARLYAAVGQWDAAISLYSQAAENDPSNGKVRAFLEDAKRRKAASATQPSTRPATRPAGPSTHAGQNAYTPINT